MLSHLITILAKFDAVPKQVMPIFARYLFYLMLDTKRHELRSAAEHFGYHESSYSRFLCSAKAVVQGKSSLNRAARRRIKVIKADAEVFLIIDATMIGRSGKKYENKAKFYSGRKYVDGYKITNICLFVGGQIIPLACLPHYSKNYCKKKGILYQTETEKITYWIEHLKDSGLLPEELIAKLHFLLDSGYDSKMIQRAIQSIGAHFTMSIKQDRQVNGQQVIEYFRDHRHIRYRTIRLTDGNGSTNKRCSEYRIRSAGRCHLKGFGAVCVVSSQKLQRRGLKSAKKFLVTSKLTQSARKTVKTYALRWQIETWHRLMKQKFGYGDCRALKFSAVEAHLNLCLLAFNISRSEFEGLPKPGTSLEEFLSAQQWKLAGAALTKFGGKQKVKSIATAKLQAIATLKACA